MLLSEVQPANPVAARSRRRPHCLYLGAPDALDGAFPEPIRAEVARLGSPLAVPITPENWRDFPRETAQAECILGSWGMPRLDTEFLDAFPRLRAVFYAAGTVKYFVTEESFRREIVVCSAAAANAIPVAEYTLSMTLLSLKNFWRFERQVRSEHSWHRPRNGAARGAYRSVVGLISLGAVGRAVARTFSSFNLNLIAYDPFVSPDAAKKLGVTLVSLEELFRASDVVSVHAPLIPETVNLIDGSLLSKMKPGATFINSSRGAIVNEADLCRVLRARPDLTAILDVTSSGDDPPGENSPLYGQPNIILTPHIAGSLGNEISRMGDWMVEEMQRYLDHAPLLHRIDPEKIASMA